MNASLGRLRGAWDLATGSVWMNLHYHTSKHSNIGISQDSLEKGGQGGVEGGGGKREWGKREGGREEGEVEEEGGGKRGGREERRGRGGRSAHTVTLEQTHQ